MSLSWSFSALKDYEGCPRRYHEVRVLKNHTTEKTTQIVYGEELHKAAEEYVLGTPLPPQFSFIQDALDALMSKDGEKLPEIKMAVTEQLEPCEWFSKEAWLRGVADLLILDTKNNIAWVVDYKTGNNKYPDKDQLELMSLLTFAHYPEVKQVNSALMFVVKNSLITHKVMHTDKEALWWKYRERVAKIVASLSNDVWNPKQTPLCGWCPVRSCEFNR